MKSSSKSQITMLMIIGLTLFIVISLVLYLSKSAVKKQSQQNIKIIQETAIETQPIKDFAAKCMDKLAKDAIVMIGRQGGYIYKSQGGNLVDYEETDEGIFFVNYNGVRSTYNILQPKFAVQSYSSDAPEYPWPTFPYRTSASNAEIAEGYFGISNMPPLNAPEGPNSIQTQLENFIDSNLAGCIDISIFEKQGLSIEMQQPKTTATISGSNTFIQSKIPMTITNPATRESTELHDFSTNVDIRLKDMYFFVKELIGNDIKNVKFDIDGSGNDKDSFSVKLMKGISSQDDIIIVTDEKSLIYGKPFEYVFARRNRMPALHYIRKNILEFPQGYILNMSSLIPNQKLAAEDPDEDNYTFTITPALPKKLEVPQLKFKIEVSDGQLADHQTITVNRK
ncbi:hypothetical protein HYV80_00305 [Candidatus Woesearchaeota archaeon]|nr:hypothetical protein [Candidatus Woesearchaeota archaeon]